MTEIKENVEAKDIEVGTEETETTKVEENNSKLSNSEQKSDKVEQKTKAKSQKRTKTPKKKEVKVMTPFEESKAILGKVCNKFKDCTISPTKTGSRIKRGTDIIACANLHECKITIPVEGEGLKVWFDNKHMTRIPHGHKDLAKLFEMRCKDKRTNREVIDDTYGKGEVTPGHARLRGTTATAEELEAKAKALMAEAKAMKKAERKGKATKKARKAKKVAKATA